HTRPRSLRMTSTIMTFSARSFALSASSAARPRSSAGSAARGRVPLIGRVSTRPPRSSRKRSGLAETTKASPASRKAAYGARERLEPRSRLPDSIFARPWQPAREQPRPPRAVVIGADHVVEAEVDVRQPQIVGCDARQPFQPTREVVGPQADDSPGEGCGGKVAVWCPIPPQTPP